jgi:hypothetical protein
MKFTNNRNTALQFYAALQRWGRNSGFKRNPDETPMEYGNRLSNYFPQTSAEIMLIIEMLHWEVYGETALYSQQIMDVRKSWKKLRSPLMWPFRLKSIMKNSWLTCNPER